MNRPHTPTFCESCSEKIVCRCLRVTEAEVIQVITQLELRSIKEIRREIGAGDGCTCCHSQLEEYLEKFGCTSALAG